MSCQIEGVPPLKRSSDEIVTHEDSLRVKCYGVLCTTFVLGLDQKSRIFWLNHPGDEMWIVEPVNNLAFEALETAGHLKQLSPDSEASASDLFFSQHINEIPNMNTDVGSVITGDTFVPSLSHDAVHVEYFKEQEFPQTRNEEDIYAMPSIKPQYPPWFQDIANAKAKRFQINTTIGLFDILLNVFPLVNTAFLHGGRSCRKFYTTPSLLGKYVRGYCVFVMYVNSNIKCKWCYMAYTRLIVHPDFANDEDVKYLGPLVYARSFLTMCNLPRPDHGIICIDTMQMHIWQGHHLIRKFYCNPSLDMCGKTREDIDQSVAVYYGRHVMLYNQCQNVTKFKIQPCFVVDCVSCCYVSSDAYKVREIYTREKFELLDLSKGQRDNAKYMWLTNMAVEEPTLIDSLDSNKRTQMESKLERVRHCSPELEIICGAINLHNVHIAAETAVGRRQCMLENIERAAQIYEAKASIAPKVTNDDVST